MNSSKDKSKPEYTLVKPPPHTITSVGKEEDSIQNCLQLQPKVPKRNLKKLLDYAGKVFNFMDFVFGFLSESMNIIVGWVVEFLTGGYNICEIFWYNVQYHSVEPTKIGHNFIR